MTQRVLDDLSKQGDRYILVFGSLSTPKRSIERPEIRFVDSKDPAGPDHPLSSLAVSGDRRFYAVLRNAPLDFYAEAGSRTTGFDRIMYTRVREGEAPVAIYLGELLVSPAPDRAANGQKLIVQARDDFQNAQRELKQLYPRFAGPVIKTAILRASAKERLPRSKGEDSR